MKIALNRMASFALDASGMMSGFAIYLLLMILLIGGLAVDYSNGIRARAHLRVVVESAALAAAQDLPDADAARTTALQYVSLNAPSARFGTTVTPGDVVIGNWDSTSRTFTANATPSNAVQILAHRRAADGNGVSNLFLSLFGKPGWDVSAETVAIGDGNLCTAGGIFSRARVIAGGNNPIAADFCLYGDLGVTIGVDNTFAENSLIEMPDLNDFVYAGSNPGMEDALSQGTRDLELLDATAAIVDSLRTGGSTYRPVWAINGPVYLENITPSTVLQPNTFYVVNNDVDLGSYRTVQDVVIAAGHNITSGVGVAFRNVILAAVNDITIGAENDLGASTYCADGAFDVAVLAKDDIVIGGQALLRGAQVAALDLFTLDPGARGVRSSRVEAQANATFDSATEFTGCDVALASDYFSGLEFDVFGLVR